LALRFRATKPFLAQGQLSLSRIPPGLAQLNRPAKNKALLTSLAPGEMNQVGRVNMISASIIQLDSNDIDIRFQVHSFYYITIAQVES
jgi:hypothetical protein